MEKKLITSEEWMSGWVFWGCRSKFPWEVNLNSEISMSPNLTASHYLMGRHWLVGKVRRPPRNHVGRWQTGRSSAVEQKEARGCGVRRATQTLIFALTTSWSPEATRAFMFASLRTDCIIAITKPNPKLDSKFRSWKIPQPSIANSNRI